MRVRYRVLATDYDGTIACDGYVDPSTRAALRRVRDSGRRVVLVTGRELPDLVRVFGELALFGVVVAENGAVLHDPSSDETTILSPPPPAELLVELERSGVERLSIGRAIVAADARSAGLITDAMHRLGLELQLSFNRGAVMVLPVGVNKATGVLHALERLGLTPSSVVAIGDGENDHPLLAVSGLGIAVANAVPALRARADVVTNAAGGAGVVETVEWLLAADITAGLEVAPPESPTATLDRLS